MTDDQGIPPAAPPLPQIPPEPPLAPPPRSRGVGWRTVALAAVAAVAAAAATVFALPLFFGANPVDVLGNKGKGSVQEVKTVEERVVKAGQEAVVEVAARVLPSVVNIEVQYGILGKGIGSGFIYRSDGYIITNNHVVENASNIKVSLRDGSVHDAKVVGTDPETDIAVIRIDESDLPPVTLGTSSDLVPGELAVAVGSPEGFEGSVTSGIISALNRNIYVPDAAPLLDVIQTDAAINPGNSGGPLCNSVGEVIGINTAIYSQSGGYDGLGFAIAIDNAKPVIEQLIENGVAVHPWLGFNGSTLDPETARSYDLPVEKGAIVRRVISGTPAEKAGLQAGDIIVAIDGSPVDSMDQVMLEIRRRKVGDSVAITYYRGKEKRETTAVLEEKPSRAF
ncbi:MAG: trypsin-like peptidase domain-containing protein [Actinobacteria bacterium]|nr:trypsin-like peptidase domain-containing protein [Actinomycetota bacterium]MDI6830736.1 trypsin-like peptidase domain-containing protein [Actinomycetota bacterium]